VVVVQQLVVLDIVEVEVVNPVLVPRTRVVLAVVVQDTLEEEVEVMEPLAMVVIEILITMAPMVAQIHLVQEALLHMVVEVVEVLMVLKILQS
jgi:hypothetical protein